MPVSTLNTDKSVLTRIFSIAAFAGIGLSIMAMSAEATDKVTITEPGLKPYVVVGGFEIQESLSGKPGDAKKGRELFVHRKKGNCLTCHTAPIPEQDFHGQVGPDLTGVGSRMSVPEIRLRIVNPKIVNPATIMMAYYHTSDLEQVKKSFVNKPMLTEQEIEDVVAYLASLK